MKPYHIMKPIIAHEFNSFSAHIRIYQIFWGFIEFMSPPVMPPPKGHQVHGWAFAVGSHLLVVSISGATRSKAWFKCISYIWYSWCDFLTSCTNFIQFLSYVIWAIWIHMACGYGCKWCKYQESEMWLSWPWCRLPQLRKALQADTSSQLYQSLDSQCSHLLIKSPASVNIEDPTEWTDDGRWMMNIPEQPILFIRGMFTWLPHLWPTDTCPQQFGAMTFSRLDDSWWLVSPWTHKKHLTFEDACLKHILKRPRGRISLNGPPCEVGPPPGPFFKLVDRAAMPETGSQSNFGMPGAKNGGRPKKMVDYMGLQYPIYIRIITYIYIYTLDMYYI